MTEAKATTNYSATAKWLHWTIAALIIGLFIGGKFMTHLGLDTQTKYLIYQFHKSLGFTILALSLYRLYWRLKHPVPKLPEGMSTIEQRIAPITHWLFYAFMIVVPLLGWLYVSAIPKDAGNYVDTKIFFIIPVFHWPVPQLAWLESFLDDAHSAVATAMIGLLVLHVAAALKHHYKDKDEVFLRMLPGETSKKAGMIPVIIGLLLASAALYLIVMLIWGEDDHYEEGAVAVPSENSVQNIPAMGPYAWSIDNADTFVELKASAFGSEKSVRIGDVRGLIVLDPENPSEKGRLDVELFMTSLDAGDTSTTSELRGKEWFNISEHPVVRFVSENISGENGQYIAEGELTIRETTIPLVLPFALNVREDVGVADGELMIDRTAFDLGGSGDSVSQNVAVRIKVTASSVQE